MPLVSLILVTMRPWLLPAICAMLTRQTYVDTELVVALHGYKLSDLAPAEQLAIDGARTILEIHRDRSLGYCINQAVAESRGTFVAKIDDDDLYGRQYLAEAVGHLLAGDGDVVGKSEVFVYLEESGAIVLRKPGTGLRAVNFVAGATMVSSRSFALLYPFSDITAREDTAFQQDARLGGATIYATSRRNFMCIRRAAKDDHTWKVTDGEMIESGVVLKRRPRATRAELLATLDERLT